MKISFNKKNIVNLFNMKNRLLSIITLVSLTSGIAMIGGCTQEEIDAAIAAANNIANEQNQNPGQEVQEPEVTVDPEVEPEVEPEIEPEVKPEELGDPEFILYNDDGSLYVPMHVTMEDFNNKLAEANEKYEWKSIWDRDRYIGLLLYENAYYMDDEDIKEIYYDYLDNFGIDVLDNEHEWIFDQASKKSANSYSTVIDLEDFFIDPRLALEAKKFQPYQYDKERDQFANKDGVRDMLNNIDYSNDGIYTIVFEEEMYRMMFAIGDKCIRGVLDHNHVIWDSKEKVWNQINMDEEKMADNGEYEISEYVSSHPEMGLKLK